MRVLQMALYIITGPIRFFIINGQILLATLLWSISITPQNGYPWPGFVSYSFPGLAILFLGILYATALLRLWVIQPVRGWGTLLCFLLFSLSTSFLFKALLPSPESLSGMITMALVAVFIWKGFNSTQREKYVLHSLIFAFGLILFKFIFMKSPLFQAFSTVAGIPAFFLSSVSAESTTTMSPLDEYIVFTGFIVYASAMVLQYPSNPAPVHDLDFTPSDPALSFGDEQRLISSPVRKSISYDGFTALPQSTDEDTSTNTP